MHRIVLHNCPNTNSIVGTDICLYRIVGAINSHTIRPPTCLWASIVLLAPGFTVLGERGETPLMPIGIEQYLQVPTSTIPKEGKTTSHMRLTLYSDDQQCCRRLPLSCTRWHGQQSLVAYVPSPSTCKAIPFIYKRGCAPSNEAKLL